MADLAPQFEGQDNVGRTQVYAGTAGIVESLVPLASGQIISGVGIDNVSNTEFLVSFDGGTSFKTIDKSSFLSWNIKGEIRQLRVKTLSGTADYEIIINFEDN